MTMILALIPEFNINQLPITLDCFKHRAPSSANEFVSYFATHNIIGASIVLRQTKNDVVRYSAWLSILGGKKILRETSNNLNNISHLCTIHFFLSEKATQVWDDVEDINILSKNLILPEF